MSTPEVDSVLRWFSNHLQPVPPEEKRKPDDPLVFTAYDLARGRATHRIAVTKERRGLRGIFGGLTRVVRVVPVER